MKQRPAGRAGGNQVRIVGGEWRGRRLGFPDADGLRPSGDRLRETLFNWLQPWLAGSHCLDLFAGSGALAFEALSRGAATAVMVERAPAVAAALRDNARLLGAGPRLRVEQRDALAFLADAPRPEFDLVFLDPPFDAGLLPAVCTGLRGWLRESGAWVYLEMDRRTPTPVLDAGWELHRNKQQGEVRAELYRVAPRD